MLRAHSNCLFHLKHGKVRLVPCLAFCSQSGKTDLDAAYVPSAVEKAEFDCYKYFKPKLRNDKAFSMILPPPNITGNLHLGHALTVTVQDVILRWKQMEGRDCVWIPGIDHAGIATQVVVEKVLWKEKRQSRHDIGRETFQERVWKWKEEKANVIEMQLKRMGASLDWSRGVFTMDSAQSLEVNKAFTKLFESGLIYRADHIVNWSCSLQSAISDIEVEHVEIDGATNMFVPNYDKPIEFGTLTQFAYKIHETEDEIVVATTRPETIFGDVAVAVNPRDDRYSRYIGRTLWHPFRKETIPVISDDFVDPAFGTGAVKVTPAHDPSDFLVAKRHSLPILHVIDEKGNLGSKCGPCAGMQRFEARQTVAALLESSGLLRAKHGHRMLVPVCSRSKDIVEYLVRPQWFIKCSQMAKEAVEDVRVGRLQLEPRDFERVWFDWLEDVRDWCISRQLWWGHRIPAYSCRILNSPEPAIWIAAENPQQAFDKASARLCTPEIEIKQDEDVLDTWFSSALLPFSAFSQQDSEKYYPLSLMETGHDILFFWVARMLMLGKELTGRLPFEKVLLHGIICDAHGRKMSKSLGNVIMPEDVIEGSSLEKLASATKESHLSGVLSVEEVSKALSGQRKMFPSGIPECGADALRFTLCAHSIKSHFINFDVQECHTNRLFCNKIWQAARYTNGVFGTLSQDLLKPIEFECLGPMDKWILSKLSQMVELCRTGMENEEFHLVTAAIKEFLYFRFCDVYLETTKRAFKEKSEAAAQHCWTLTTCLDVALRALAPFMPRLAQHLHSRLKEYPGVVKTVEYPQSLQWRNVGLEDDVEKVLEVVVGIRRMKKLFGVVSKHNPEAYIVGNSTFYDPFKATIADLSVLHKLTLATEMSQTRLKDTICDRVAADTLLHLVVPLDLRQSLELDLPKLEAKKLKLIKEMEKMNKMMSAENYKIKATNEAQKSHVKKIATLEEKLARINYIQTLYKQ